MVILRCARCGRETNELVEGRLCPNCYLEVYGLGEPPREISLTICPRCGAYRFRGEWYEPPGGGLEEIVGIVFASLFKPRGVVKKYSIRDVGIIKQPENKLLAEVRVVGEFIGIQEEYEKKYLVPVQIAKQLCPSCFRKASGAPKAIIQIRSWSKRISKNELEGLKDVIKSLDKNFMDAVIEFEEVKEGLNIKMTDQNTARMLASKLRSLFAAKVAESFKVIGRESNGKPKTRLTLSIRLPLFAKQSLVDYNDKLAIVVSVRNNKVYLRELGSERVHTIGVDDAWKSLRSPDLFDKKEAIVTAIEPEWIHLQLLDKSYKYLELPLERVVLEGRISEGSEVELIVYKGREYIIEKGLIKRSEDNSTFKFEL